MVCVSFFFAFRLVMLNFYIDLFDMLQCWSHEAVFHFIDLFF